MEFMTVTLSVLLLCIAFCFVMIFRNQLVYSTRTWLINKWVNMDTTDPYYMAYESVTYHEMMWNFRCWTRKQFFPELVKENNE
jgi:hypothetical protein